MVLSKGRLLAFAGLAAALLAAAPGPVAAQEKVKIKLVFPTAVTTFFLPYLVPQDQGWYKENGLEVEETFVNGDATAMRTLLAGDMDLAVIGPPTVFNAVIQGAKLKSIGAWQPVVDYQIVADKKIGATLKDLSGKVFAAVGPNDMTAELVRMMMKKHGVDPGETRFIQVGGHAARLQAVEAGKAQATLINTLTSVKGQRDGAVNVVARVVDDFPSVGYVMVVTKDSDLTNPQKRKAYEILTKGAIIGARFVQDKPDEAAVLLNKRTPDIDLEMTKEVVRELSKQKVWGINGGNEAEVVNFTSRVSKELSMIEREVKAEEVLDNSFVDKALADLGKR